MIATSFLILGFLVYLAKSSMNTMQEAADMSFVQLENSALDEIASRTKFLDLVEAVQFGKNSMARRIIEEQQVRLNISILDLVIICIEFSNFEFLRYLLQSFPSQVPIESRQYLILKAAQIGPSYTVLQTLLEFLPACFLFDTQMKEYLDDHNLCTALIQDYRFDITTVSASELLKMNPYVIGLFLAHPKFHPSRAFIDEISHMDGLPINLIKHGHLLEAIKSDENFQPDSESACHETWGFLLEVACLTGRCSSVLKIIPLATDEHFKSPLTLNYAISSGDPNCVLALLKNPLMMRMLFKPRLLHRHALKRLIRFALQKRIKAVLEFFWDGILAGYSPFPAQSIIDFSGAISKLEALLPIDPHLFAYSMKRIISSFPQLKTKEDNDHEGFFVSIVELYMIFKVYLAECKQACIDILPEIENFLWVHCIRSIVDEIFL